MKKMLFLGLISLALFGCEQAAENATGQANKLVEEKANEAISEPKEVLSQPAQNPVSKTEPASKRNTPGSIDLAGMVDMEVEEALEIDHMRDRIEKENWGDILNILTTSGATFVQQGTCCIVAQGEIKQKGFPWVAQLILDLDQDAVFGVQWDGEHKRIDQFEDDVEGLDTPQPMIDFTTKYNQ